MIPLKTGAARIALGAAADDHVRGITIVPIGLVYDDKGRFRSQAAIHVGPPIEVDAWVDRYASTKKTRCAASPMRPRSACTRSR